MQDEENFSTLPSERIHEAGIEGFELGVLDKNNPRSVYNLITMKGWKERLDKLQPGDFSLTEMQLRRAAGVSIELARIRHLFWEEYNRAQYYNSRMSITRMGIANLVVHKVFHEAIKDKYKLIYILTPPLDYKVQVAEGLSHGLERVREILDMDIVDPVTRKANVKVAQLVLNAVKFLDARANGAFVQKNLNINVGSPAPGSQEAISSKDNPPITISDLDKKIAEIESKMNISSKPRPIPAQGIVGVPLNDVAAKALEEEDSDE